VTVLDLNGNPVPGVAVVLSALDSTVLNPGAVTDASGVAAGSIRAVHAGTKVVSVTAGGVALTQTASVGFIGDAAHLSASLSTAAAVPAASVVADGNASAAISVVVRDVNGNGVPGVTVTLAAADATVVSPGAASDAGGAASGSISAIHSGPKTVTVTAGSGAGAVVLSQQPTVGFIADAAHLSASLSTASAAPAAGVVADGATASTVSVVVRDLNGNPVPGVPVSLTVADATASAPAATDSGGATSGAVTSIHSGAKVVTVRAGAGAAQITLAQAPGITFIGDAGHLSAALSSAAASPATGVVADGNAAAVITVVARDVNGNAVAGVPVTLSALDATLTNPLAGTDATGSAAGAIRAIHAGVKTVTATLGSGGTAVVVGQKPTVGFIGDAAHLSSSLSSLLASPTSGVVADGAASAALTCTVLDINGNPVPGVAVALSTSDATLTGPGVTSAAGVVTAALTSIHSGAKVVAAVAGSGASAVTLAQQATVSFIGDASHLSAGLSTAVANPASGVVANGSASAAVRVTVLDVNGNPVQGVAVTLSTAAIGATLSNPPSVTDASGVATGAVRSIRSGVVPVQATAGAVAITQQAQAGFIGDAANISASKSVLVATPASGVVADGVAAAAVTVTVIDANGNPVPGVPVALSASDALVSSPALPTDAFGVATGAVSAVHAGAKTLSATVGSGADAVLVAQQATVGFIGDANHPSASLSSVTAAPASAVVADGVAASTVTITVVDVNGNPAPGALVSLAVPGALASTPASTNAGGVTTGLVRSTTSGAMTVTATVAGVALSQQATIGFIGDAAHLSAANSTVTASPSNNVSANGLATSTLTVTVRDVNNNPVPGQVVTLAAPGAVVVNPATGSDAGGVSTGFVKALTAGTKTVTATAGSGAGAIVLAQAAAVTFVADAANPSGLNSSATLSKTTAADDGVDAVTLTVTMRDINFNLLVGQPVAVTSAGAITSITPPSTAPGNTDANGQAVVTLKSTTAGLKTLTVKLGTGTGAVNLAQPLTVTFSLGPPDAAKTTVTAAPAKDLVVGAGASTITVIVKDATSNVLAGQTVALVAGDANETLTQPAAVTDATGKATGTVVASTIGAHTVSATVGGLAITQVASANWVNATHLVFLVQPPAAVKPGTSMSPALKVAAQDDTGKTDTTANGTVTLTLSNGGTAKLTGGGAATLVSGVATFSAVQVDLLGSGYALLATSSGTLASATSTTFNVTATGSIRGGGTDSLRLAVEVDEAPPRALQRRAGPPAALLARTGHADDGPPAAEESGAVPGEAPSERYRGPVGAEVLPVVSRSPEVRFTARRLFAGAACAAVVAQDEGAGPEALVVALPDAQGLAKLHRLTGQGAEPLGETNPGGDDGPEPLLAEGGVVFWRGIDAAGGLRLFSLSQGLLEDLGPAGDLREQPVLFEGALHFAGAAGGGRKLVRLDTSGPVARLVQVADSSGPSHDDAPEGLTVYGGALWYAGNAGAGGSRLLRWDGASLASVSLGGPRAKPGRAALYQGALAVPVQEPAGCFIWRLCDRSTGCE
jgi:adhesin/invasin